MLIVLISCCSVDPDKKANELYVETSQYASQMLSEKVSYSKAYNSYKNAIANIEIILSKYPSANLSVKLLSGETRIVGYTFEKFRAIDSTLKLLARAEKDILSYALLSIDHDDYSYDNELFNISLEYINKGELIIVYDILEKLQDSFYSAYLLSFMSRKLIEDGKKSDANETLLKALDRSKNIENYSIKIRVLCDIASSLESIGEHAKSNDLLKEALALIPKIEDENYINYSLSNIAMSFCLKKDFSKALSICDKIDDNSIKAFSLIDIADTCTVIGRQKEIDHILSKTLEISKNINNTDKSLILANLSKIYNKLGNSEKCIEQLDMSLKTAYEIDKPKYRCWRLNYIAEIYNEFKYIDNSKKILKESYKIAQEIQEKDDLINILIDIAGRYSNIGDRDKAIELIENAKTLSKELESEFYKDSNLSEIVGIFARLGKIKDALRITNLISDSDYKINALVNISRESSDSDKQKIEDEMYDFIHTEYPINQYWK
jgi:tetratricopeptide (TPR) repeat protein